MLIRLRTVVAAAMLTVATYAAAQAVGEHPDTYVVRKGDTLWDIAGRFLQNHGCGRKSGKPIRKSRIRTRSIRAT